jgi:nucleoside 2-deoxyribosyltransferase
VKLRVYLAGPINGKSDAECREWREWFKRCDMFEWVDPMDRDIRGREDDVELALATTNADLEEVESCDAIVANTSLGPGWGTASEMVWTWLAEKPVISICGPNISPWVRKWSTEICRNKEAALQKLKEALA